MGKLPGPGLAKHHDPRQGAGIIRKNVTCPIWPARNRVFHRRLDDPPRLAMQAGSNEEALVHYRRVCDAIKALNLNVPESLIPTEPEASPKNHIDTK